MHTLRQQHVLILGLGLSGLAMARWCARMGAQVTVADSRATPPQLAVLQQDVPAARFVAGAFHADTLPEGVHAVFISPGLKPEETRAVRDAAGQRGVPVGGELNLFMVALHALKQERAYAPYVLGITGTNGKTTVTALLGQLLQRAGQTVAVAGNIGPTLLDTLAAALDVDALPQSWVLELSSFQLHGCTVFEPTAATILNISQDHLDWHADMQEYVADKTHIFGRKGVAVLNRDDDAVMALLPQLQTQGAEAAQPADQENTGKKAAKNAQPPARRWVSFGSDTPQRPGDWGLETVNDMVWLVRATEEDGAASTRASRKENHKEQQALAAQAVSVKRLMPADALRIRGRHNACNALAALALATEANAALAPMLYGLREYRGEPHRVEPIGIIRSVEYFDDSKGTNVGATLAALQGLGAERPLVLILGGEGKGQDFSVLAPSVRKHCRAVVVMGRDGQLIAAALVDTGVPVHAAATMADAVAVAAGQAQTGDAVLLSPACASFDMFRDYVHRAEVFREAVRELALQQGVDWPEGMA